MEIIINEWLDKCKDLSNEELVTYANHLCQDEDIVQAIYVLFEERSKHSQVNYTCQQYTPKIQFFQLWSQLLEMLCTQLFTFYRSQDDQLQRFTSQFLPALIFIYLNAAAHGDIKV